jgi:hypothetical protein
LDWLKTWLSKRRFGNEAEPNLGNRQYVEPGSLAECSENLVGERLFRQARGSNLP